MIQNLAEKWKKPRARIGLIFTVTAGVFVFAMTYVAYFDQQAYARMQTFLYDCGIDARSARWSPRDCFTDACGRKARERMSSGC